MGDLNLNNIKIEFKLMENSETDWQPYGINGCNIETFQKLNPNADKSIFNALDIDQDGNITEDEYNRTLNMDADQDGIVTDKERNDACMRQYKFFARRGIDKWFNIDRNRDGLASNIEMKGWNIHNTNNRHLDGALSNKELATKYNITYETIEENLQDWLDYEIEDFKKDAKLRYGIELSEKQIIELKKEQLKQLNTWLVKDGDNENRPLYQQMNLDAYTRLMTTEETVSCCGGDIDKPPMGAQPVRMPNGKFESPNCKAVFCSLEGFIEDGNGDYERDENGNPIPMYNTSEEVKNRLAWAAFKTVSMEEAAKMSPEEYKEYQQKWNSLRSMTAADLRELLKPENESKRKEFESNSLMTVKQMVDFITYVEETIGKDWNDNDWQINGNEFKDIAFKVNGTFGDESRLEGKTRADIPKNRQPLLRFLEEKGWLYEQFK